MRRLISTAAALLLASFAYGQTDAKFNNIEANQLVVGGIVHIGGTIANDTVGGDQFLYADADGVIHSSASFPTNVFNFIGSGVFVGDGASVTNLQVKWLIGLDPAGNYQQLTNGSLVLSNAATVSRAILTNGSLVLSNGSTGAALWLTNGGAVFQSNVSAQVSYSVTATNSGAAKVGGVLDAAGGIGPATHSHATLSGTNTFLGGADVAFTRYPVTSLANGNNAGVIVGTNVFVEVSGPSGAFTICGINGSPNRDGKLLILKNATGQTMTLANQSGVDAVAGNRILTGYSADHTYTNNPGVVTLIYDGNAARWVVVSQNGNQ